MGRVALEPDQTQSIKGARTKINGIVQGVGFRPFIYNLARAKSLKGFVTNTSNGVYIEVEGSPESLDAFHRAILDEKPSLAHITSMDTIEQPMALYSDFKIRKSHAQEHRATLISPDVCICEDCLSEIFEPKDRRFGYPFINCTNCGPRYTIIMDIPYDRPFTAMKGFQMCARCEAEYNDPADRRFHAQPNACWECGPQVSLYDNKKNLINCDNPINKTCELLKKGKILAIKGLGGFHLAVDATNNKAVAALRARKHREEKPFAIMSRDVATIQRYAYVNEEERELLTLPRRPIVILKKRKQYEISDEVAPRNKNLGAMLPYTPLHYLIFKENFLALVMTSGNMTEEPIVIDNDDAFDRLAPIADYLLVHNRDIYLRSDDSILRVVNCTPRQIRRSRGYVPVPIFLKWDTEPVLACGPELKNTICLTKGTHAFLSQHIGDMENLETVNFLELTVEHLTRILEIEPTVMAYDLHPEYLSTKYALQQEGFEMIGVQHHHAHVASCMAENGVKDTVIGLALDGTGYGVDGRIWGGEILICSLESFERKGHFDYVPMPGGTAAIKEPWRMAVSYLYHTYGPEFTGLDIEFLKTLDEKRLRVMRQMIEKGVNSPKTSSLGRLFDGISALTGLRNYVKYEGQGAMELEMCMDEGVDSYYDYQMRGEDSGWILLHEPIIQGVVKDLISGTSQGRISAKFHNTLIRMLSEVCLRIRRERDLDSVALSGGVFQNAFLLENLTKVLEDAGFQVYTHSEVPSNDGGISLGQAVVASAIYKKQKSLAF